MYKYRHLGSSSPSLHSLFSFIISLSAFSLLRRGSPKPWRGLVEAEARWRARRPPRDAAVVLFRRTKMSWRAPPAEEGRPPVLVEAVEVALLAVVGERRPPSPAATPW